jgi:hypothetical protein
MLLSFKRTVDFVICGTQKGGTTALDAYLRDHPEVCMANRKETHYFDNEEYFRYQNPDYSKYHAFFSPTKRHRIIGETTPIYMYWRESPKRIFEYNPEIKIIIILRNPIDRAYSHWNMERLRNADNLPFKKAIYTEIDRCRKALPYQHRVFSYIDRGRYLEQLRRIWTHFSKERTLILKHEDLKNSPLATLGQVTSFLGITEFNNLENKNEHSLPYASQINKDEKDFLRSIYQPEIIALEAELQWDCSNWLN